ncbi:hypothetical protein [Thermophagus xiamenensis]|uniref:Protein required for attachment to host cells n=1 Tax=Thermophagus xiamenensis TaxID=385682 RepID=A0A1I2ECW8_9BACT|nr:hypothetical protein [Thermophagus xiamenensis]SFE90301.1 hypothetical protein SAMN05444380_12219 [Thermophagus xiamenensis]
MKRQVGIWMNTNRAVLVSLMDGKEEQIQTIESLVEQRAHNPREAKPGSRTGTVLVDVNKKMKQRKNQQLREFYEKVIHSINPDTSEIYIFGPSNAKKHFEKELKKHAHFCSVKLETETADKMTHPQMIAQVKKHFQHNGHKS